MYGISILSGIVILVFLMRQMRKDLFFYYMKIKWKMLTILILMIFYQFAIAIQFVPCRYFSYAPEIEWYKVHKGAGKVPYSIPEIILMLFINLITYLPAYLLVYYNIKNIDFKKYVEEVMKGYQISNQYFNSSIFIKLRVKNAILESIVHETASLSDSHLDVDVTTESSDTKSSSQNLYKKIYEYHKNKMTLA
jgi:hypothetical protein